MRYVGWLGGLALAGLIALSGCDGTPPASSSTEQATVKGRLTLKGNPLGKVEVQFNPANINRKSGSLAKAITEDNGTYEITTHVGENTITLSGAAVSQHSKALTYFNKSVDVKSGENTVDIPIP
jgi:hypothetical protein